MKILRLRQGFVLGTVPGASVYTDDSTAYTTLPDHESVKHSVGEYVRGIHTNGVESFWATLKRAHKGTFHRISPKHLNRYVQEFAGRHNMRNFDTLVQMAPAPQSVPGTSSKSECRYPRNTSGQVTASGKIGTKFFVAIRVCLGTSHTASTSC